MDSSTFLILGANGQLGLALQGKYPNAQTADSKDLDITDQDAVQAYDWTGISTIINAAAYTNVDGAETNDGRVTAWKVNAEGVRNLTGIASRHDLILLHVSSDYVFDGAQASHTEEESFSPLGVYGQTKAAGDLAVSLVPKHYIVRATWIIGEGKNFVRTMLGLGRKGINPTVVADQIGRLTFTDELVRIIDHLLTTQALYGTYNATNGGEPASWADVTREIFADSGYDLMVTDTSTANYYADKEGVAPRPLNSALDLTKLGQTGFVSHDWHDDLKDYVRNEMEQTA